MVIAETGDVVFSDACEVEGEVVATNTLSGRVVYLAKTFIAEMFLRLICSCDL